ncbi:hypothetical protein L227DRAFT_117860 [Lentinus tigrinus ALCF2SS1-6]|uniref:Uncharacterized protein n=1 Tax=Lentinus tigrinus ALCF2SS1-6 TaxID=1328759 RepID=A0A5C2S7R5_9APHY|nr:hypothetical protein L227DRAFT_117860 [Lentinus tigrinus ALCF2SS1-6]
MFRGGFHPREGIWGDTRRVGAGSKMRGEMHRRVVTAGMIDERTSGLSILSDVEPKEDSARSGRNVSAAKCRRSGNPSSDAADTRIKWRAGGGELVCPVRRPHTYAPARQPPPCADAISCGDLYGALLRRRQRSKLGSTTQQASASIAMAQAAWLPLSASTERRSEFGM